MAVPALLGVASFVLAFVQRTGLATADTKINLHVDPARFLSDVASMWTSTGQLGGVQSGQQTGYLFPMGPFFALGHALGLSDWVVQRLWLGTLLALAAWGVVRLLDALHPAPRGVVAPRGRGGDDPQPVRRHVCEPHDRDAARLRRAAVAPARCPPRPAGESRLALAGRVRAARNRRGRRRQRRGRGLDARRATAVARLRGAVRRRRLGGRPPLHAPGRSARGARVRVVDRSGLRPVEVRRRFPEVHRAARDRLGHDERDRESAADGVLALVRRDRVHGPRDPVLRRREDPPVLAAGRRRHAAAARRGADLVPRRTTLALRAVLPRARPRRRADHAGRVPGGHAAASRADVHLQPRRGCPFPAGVVQGSAARGDRARVSRRGGGGGGVERGSGTGSPPARSRGGCRRPPPACSFSPSPRGRW